MKSILFWPALLWLGSLLAFPLAAQSDPSDPTAYQGPGVLSSGGSDIGARSGQQVDLRFWGGINAVYDTNVQPFTTDAHGNLIRVPNLIGTEASFGAYGSHHWEHAQLSLSYTGTYDYYPNDTVYNGTNQALALNYTVQYSNRVLFDVRLTGATLMQNTGAVVDAATATGILPTTQLFDSRASYVDVTGSMTLIQSARTSYTFSGGGDGNYFESDGLTSSTGYHVNAGANYRTSLTSTIGAIYTYSTQDASGGSFSSRTQTLAGQYFGTFARVWTLNVTAGASYAQVHQLVAVQRDVVLAGQFGVVSGILPYDIGNFYPTGKAELTRHFQRAAATVSYVRSVAGGNGFFLSTRNETASAGISYTGVHKWNFGIQGSYQQAVGLGEGSGTESSYGGGAGVTYEVARNTHISAHFDVGHYNLGVGSSYDRTTDRATLGIFFSPGNIPLSLW